LKAVQVIKYIPKEVRNPFGAVEGGFVLEDPNPFKTKAEEKPKSNNVLEAAPADDDDDDGFDEAPVKRTAKAATPTPTEGGGDLGDIIKTWDD
jgi:hypothetical protein